MSIVKETRKSKRYTLQVSYRPAEGWTHIKNYRFWIPAWFAFYAAQKKYGYARVIDWERSRG